MASGILFVAVGPSGVGKDTLIAGAMERLGPTGRYVRARRVITRPAGPGEDHEAVSQDEFDRRAASAAFLHRWTAHGFSYGLGADLRDHLAAGRHVVANGSRAALSGLAGRVDRLVVIEIAASGALLKERIVARGRETGDDVDRRVAREVEPFPPDIDLLRVTNDGTVEDGVEQMAGALEAAASRLAVRRLPIRSGRGHTAFFPLDSTMEAAGTYPAGGRIEILGGTHSVRAAVAFVEPGWALKPDEIGLSAEAFAGLGLPEGRPVAIRRTPAPSSSALLRRKIDGGRLAAEDYETLFRDVIEDRYPESEVAAFLVKAIQNLDDEEVVAVAQARCRFTPRIAWPAPIVVDKHSLGGIPGSRITLIVVPIVAAHGLLMPKTSSRAITSASGTADAMEAAARVDLDSDAVRRVVSEARGCIAWNGQLNHSALDDVVNAITRPLGLDSNRWSVASILSKKWTAGSTHVVVDLPYGPRAKLKTLSAARDLGRVFERVGAGLGLEVRALPTDGRGAIGRGIGPALELRDVERVLDGAADAPQDLRDKALRFAGEILSFDPAVGDRVEGRRRAEEILASGAARAQFERIVAAQGTVRRVRPGPLTHAVRSPAGGVVAAIDGWHLAGIARSAGAPADKSSGIDLAVSVGDGVAAGQALYTVHAGSQADLDEAIAATRRDPGVVVEEARATA